MHIKVVFEGYRPCDIKQYVVGSSTSGVTSIKEVLWTHSCLVCGRRKTSVHWEKWVYDTG